MIRFLADENFSGNIVRGVLRQLPNADIVRVQDVGLSGVDDPDVLAWAAREGRILLTHDVATITKFAYDRVRSGLAMPGVIEIEATVGVGRAIDEIVVAAEYADAAEFNNQVRYLPL